MHLARDPGPLVRGGEPRLLVALAFELERALGERRDVLAPRAHVDAHRVGRDHERRQRQERGQQRVVAAVGQRGEQDAELEDRERQPRSPASPPLVGGDAVDADAAMPRPPTTGSTSATARTRTAAIVRNAASGARRRSTSGAVRPAASSHALAGSSPRGQARREQRAERDRRARRPSASGWRRGQCGQASLRHSVNAAPPIAAATYPQSTSRAGSGSSISPSILAVAERGDRDRRQVRDAISGTTLANSGSTIRMQEQRRDRRRRVAQDEPQPGAEQTHRGQRGGRSRAPRAGRRGPRARSPSAAARTALPAKKPAKAPMVISTSVTAAKTASFAHSTGSRRGTAASVRGSSRSRTRR